MPDQGNQEDYLHYIQLIHKSLNLLKDRDDLITRELQQCHAEKKKNKIEYSGQSEEQDFPASGRAVQEKSAKPSFGEVEVAPVKFVKHSKSDTVPPPSTGNLSLENLDNFNGKVEGEEDHLVGSGEEEEVERKEEEKEEDEEMNKITDKMSEEDDLLTGDAVTAVGGGNQVLTNAKQEKSEGRPNTGALDWRKNESSDLPSVDIGKIKSILDETAN